MAARDELPDGLRERLAAMAAADLDGLIAEARAEARAQVKQALREEYAAALLGEAAPAPAPAETAPAAGRDAPAPAPTATAPGGPAPTEPAPAPASDAQAPPADAGHGWWVYCVVAADREPPRGLAAVAGGDSPRLVSAAGLAALVSPVPLSEFGEAPLRENLNDLAWLERTVRAHETVLDAMLAGGAVVPMRVCTIYRDEAQVRTMLSERDTLFEDALRRLAGRAEWGVKIVADRTRLEQHARSHSDEARALAEDAEGGTEGGAYLARKKLAALVRDESDRILDGVVRETHARLEEWAASSVILPAQNRELAGYQGEMVFNGAYLVEDERLERFAALLDDLRAHYAALGLAFDLTGPWPAYNFAGAAPASEVHG